MIMRKSLYLVALASAFALRSPGQSQTPFSNDSATGYLKTIAVEIGPRPMGSPNERKGMEFALRKFRQFGLTETYLMPISEYPSFPGGAPTNTHSGVAVGVLRGQTDRIIVIGGHMDSVDPDVPGANDDGSGSAVVIELARVLSQRKNESTIVFALFGGEEAGLQGSRYFVDHFPDLKRVSLMLQIDMANGSPLLFPTLDVANCSSPEWLVRASYEEFEKLGLTGLHYPTDFFVFMNSLPGGGVGSDHEPFLERNIPAIDFTSDARDPIHTPQDNYDNFHLNGLKRSGDLIYKLAERFDSGVPAQKTGNYYLYQIGSHPFFVPIWSLQLFIVLSLIISGIAVVLVRRRRGTSVPVPQPKIPGLKLFLLMLIIQICVWLSENVVSLIKGVRYPWMVDVNGYYVLAFFGACIGIWISLQLSPKLQLRRDAYGYFFRAAILLAIFIALTSILSAKLALYPATALFLLSLAMLIRQPILKILFWLLSPHFMFRLFFTEAFDFLARIIHSTPDITRPINAAFVAFCVLFFALWSFPFLLGFAAVYFDSGSDILWMNRLRSRVGGLAAALLFVITVIVLSLQPSYSNEWKPSYVVNESFDADSTFGDLLVKSNEHLGGTRLSFEGRDTTFRGWSTSVVFNKALVAPAIPWLSVERTDHTTRKDSLLNVELLFHINMKYMPLKLSVSLSPIHGKIVNASSSYASSTSSSGVMLQWGAFPDSSLTIPISLEVSGGDSLSLREHVEAVFIQEPSQISVQPAIPAPLVRRTSFVKSTTVSLH